MGRKPVVALVGLVWAGMALVGCENCKNCRDKFIARPTFPTKNTDTAAKDGPALPSATPAANDAAVSGGTKPEPASKQPEAPISGFGTTTGASASQTTIGTSANSANIQRTSLRSEDPTPRLSNPPGRNDELANSSQQTPGLLPVDNAMRIPTAPVRPQTAAQRRIPFNSTSPTEIPRTSGQEDLPPIVTPSSLPASPLMPSGSTPPLPPEMPAKMAVPMSPPSTSNALPTTP